MSHNARRGAATLAAPLSVNPGAPCSRTTGSAVFYLPGIGNTARLSSPSRSTATTPKK